MYRADVVLRMRNWQCLRDRMSVKTIRKNIWNLTDIGWNHMKPWYWAIPNSYNPGDLNIAEPLLVLSCWLDVYWDWPICPVPGISDLPFLLQSVRVLIFGEQFVQLLTQALSLLLFLYQPMRSSLHFGARDSITEWWFSIGLRKNDWSISMLVL